MDELDSSTRYREEEEDNKIATVGQYQITSLVGSEETTIVAWEPDDPENPYNWSTPRKSFLLAASMLVITNSALGSSLPSNAIPFMALEWGITSEQQKVLPMSVYLIGTSNA